MPQDGGINLKKNLMTQIDARQKCFRRRRRTFFLLLHTSSEGYARLFASAQYEDLYGKYQTASHSSYDIPK